MKGFGSGVIGVGTGSQLYARAYATTPGAQLAAVCDAGAEVPGYP